MAPGTKSKSNNCSYAFITIAITLHFRYMYTNDFSKRRDDFSQRRERLVDVSAFLEARAFGASGVCTLRSRQVH